VPVTGSDREFAIVGRGTVFDGIAYCRPTDPTGGLAVRAAGSRQTRRSKPTLTPEGVCCSLPGRASARAAQPAAQTAVIEAVRGSRMLAP
jgi:hypothetical protein